MTRRGRIKGVPARMSPIIRTLSFFLSSKRKLVGTPPNAKGKNRPTFPFPVIQVFIPNHIGGLNAGV